MRKISLSILLLLFSVFIFALHNFKRNAAYLELLGNGLLISGSYEKQFSKEPGLGLRIGAGYYRNNDQGYLTIPAGIVYLIRTHKKNTFLELGFGATWTRADVELYTMVEHRDPLCINRNERNFVPSIGFRKQSIKNRFIRFNIAPVINQYGILPYLGLAMGKVF